MLTERLLLNLRNIIRQWTGLHPSLASIQPMPTVDHLPGPSDIRDIMKDGILWGVPKFRRSKERRMTRRLAEPKMHIFAGRKKHILSCLRCGHDYERHTICGNCYKMVKDETEALQSEMNQDERLFAQPTKPWSFLYRGENEKPGMHSVKVDRDRPKWWPAELLEKRNK